MVVRYEKMSKSRGNVVSPDDVVFGVHKLAEGWMFFDEHDWFVPANDVRRKSFDGHEYMRTSTRAPVFLWHRRSIARFWIPEDNGPTGEIRQMRIRSIVCGDGEQVVHERPFD